MKIVQDLKLKSMKDLQSLEVSELVKEIKNMSKMLFELEMKLQLKELKQTHLIKYLRRYIAMANTLLRNKLV